MRTAARVFAAIKRFEALKSLFPRVRFSRRLTNPRLTPMEPALSGKPVNVYQSGAYDRGRGGRGSIVEIFRFLNEIVKIQSVSTGLCRNS